MSKLLYRLKKILLKLRACYTPDLRALALMRVGLAIIIVVDLLIRWSDLTAHYTNEGVWTSDLIYHSGWKNGYWSFHTLSDKSLWQTLLFSIHLLLAIFLLVGFKTRISSLLLFLFYISLHNRNIFILQAGDDLMRLTLMWGIFLPWSQHYAIDSINKSPVRKFPFFAAFGYYVMIASVYVFSVLLKYGNDWHQNNNAVYYALSLEQLRLPFGDWLYYKATLLPLLTKLVFYIEVLIPILILWPTKKTLPKLLAFFLIAALHITIGLSIFVGLFWAISVVCAIGLLPKNVMNNIENKLRISTKIKSLYRNTKTNFAATNLLLVTLLIFCFVINVSTLPQFNYTLRASVLQIGNALRIDQYWGMFSPDVLRKDGWLVYHGSDKFGRQWDLRTNQNYVDYKKPNHIVDMYKNDRWRKLAENMQDERFTFLRPLYCKYVLKTWNEKHPEKQIVLLDLYFMEKYNLENYKVGPTRKTLYSVCNE